MDLNHIQPATAIKYQTLYIPSFEDLTETKLNELILLAQGEPVEIMDTKYVESAMKIFHYLYKYSPECTYRTLKNNRYLLYDHHSIPIIREGDIISFWIENIQIHNKIILPTTFVDVEDLWNITYGLEIDRTRQLLMSLQELPRAEQVILTGNAHTLVYLLVQEFFEGVCKTLFYHKSKDTKAIKIY